MTAAGRNEETVDVSGFVPDLPRSNGKFALGQAKTVTTAEVATLVAPGLWSSTIDNSQLQLSRRPGSVYL